MKFKFYYTIYSQTYTLSKLIAFLVPIKVTLLSIADKAQIDLGSVLILN